MIVSKMATMQQNYFAFVSSVKPNRRLRCSVNFNVVSKFHLQRGRALVAGIINMIQVAPCVKVQARADRVYWRSVAEGNLQVERAENLDWLPQTSVWRQFRGLLLFKPHRLQLVQALRANETVKRAEFCERMLQNMEDDKFLPRVISSDEATFHPSGKVKGHNVRIWGLQNPHTTLNHERESPKLNVFCATSQTKV
jgi:hypothetical protein